jgi:hypothetical protein
VSLAALVGKAALALGEALKALLLPGAVAPVALARPAADGGGAPIGEPDDDEGSFEDDDDDDEGDEDDDDDEEPLRA